MAQETVVLSNMARAPAGIALLHLGGGDEIIAVKAGNYAFGRRQAVC